MPVPMPLPILTIRAFATYKKGDKVLLGNMVVNMKWILFCNFVSGTSSSSAADALLETSGCRGRVRERNDCSENRETGIVLDPTQGMKIKQKNKRKIINWLSINARIECHLVGKGGFAPSYFFRADFVCYHIPDLWIMKNKD